MSCFLAATALAQEEGTAYEALKVVGTQFNRAALNRVISVTGADGNPQPEKWTVLIADRNAPSGVRELQVADGQIISDRTPNRDIVGTTEGAIINTSRLNLDSNGAFTVANYTADKSHTNFYYASYTLRTNGRGIPVWIVTLQDESRRPVGTIHIAANKGNVTRVEGMYAGANMANVEEDQGELSEEEIASGDTEVASDEEIDFVDEDEEGENAIKREIKRMFRRTKRDAGRMFGRVRRSFDDFVRRE